MENISRRGFIAGVTALSAMGWRRAALAAGFPAYWGDALARAAARTRELSKTCADGFWFMTDPHFRHSCRRSGPLLAELVKSSPLAKMLCGGDLPVAFADGFKTDRAAVDYAIDTYREDWVKPIRASGGKVYTTKGNHDFCVCHAWNPPEDRKKGFTYGGDKAHAVIMGDFTEPDVVTNKADPTACYYYFDNAAARIRYIVADSCDAERAGDVPWGVAYGMHATQLAWLAGEAFAKTPTGWSIVVMHHIPVTGVVDTPYAPFRDLLEAYQNRGTYVVPKSDRKFDFAQAGGRILLDLAGHVHCDMATYQKGVLYATVTSDAYVVDGGRADWWTGPVERKKNGTSSEQAFDGVQFDTTRRLIHFTRVGGGGHDRTFHLDATRVAAGKTHAFAAKLLEGPVSWFCYDADGVDNVKHPTSQWTQIAKPRNAFGTIAADGTFTAIKAGEAMVFARTPDGRQEIFPVTIA